MIRSLLRVAALVLIHVVTTAHVGSPDAWFEGKAGPYHVTVQVETAGVIPGVAKVYVRAMGAQPDQVTIQANRFDATGGAPPPEPTERVAGDDALFFGRLWIMTGGSNSVTVNLSGANGSGKVVVPVVVVAYSRLELDWKLGAGLAAMGIFLFAGLITILGAASREGSLAPGQPPTRETRNRARKSMAVTAAIGVLLLAGGWKWWGSEDRNYERRMYRPLSSRASVDTSSGSRSIRIDILDSGWIHRSDTAWLGRRGGPAWSPLVEDHGKLMHLFVVKDDLGAFAHLHPATQDSISFSAPLPPLPPGTYRIYADIVHESGFTHTLVDTTAIAASALPTAVGDPDDSWHGGGPAAGGRADLGNGASMVWDRGTAQLIAGRPAPLRFKVMNADGTPAILEPYTGMPAHAVVQRSDGSVFVHLHPNGTISMASQMAFEMRTPADSIRGSLARRLSAAEMSSMQHASPTVGDVSFPYAFPKEGRYRVWVQVKLAGKITTAAFDADVSAAPPS